MRVLCPATLEEALAARAASPGAVVLAGGTDLLVAWRSEEGGGEPETVLALSRIEALRRIEAAPERIEIGAAVPHAELARREEIRRALPALAAAAAGIGAPAVRNMGTIAGNLVTASPAADLPPALLVYGARVRLASVGRKRREVPIERFLQGYRAVDLRDEELLVSVVVPRPPEGSFSRYVKIGTRRAQSCAKLSLAGWIDGGGGGRVAGARLAAGSVAERAVRLPEAEACLLGAPVGDAAAAARAGAAAARAASPIDDVRSTAAYRSTVLGRLVEGFALDAAAFYG